MVWLIGLVLLWRADFARAVDLGLVSFEVVRDLTESDRSNLLRLTAEVLQSLVKGTLGKPKGTCVQAGWVFHRASCDLPAVRDGCATGEIRCAAWTGKQGCVTKGDASLYTCLNSRTEKEAARALYYFTYDGTGLRWATIWKTVRAACLSSPRDKSCGTLHDFVSNLGRKPNGTRADSRLIRGRRILAVLWSLIGIPIAHAESCGLDSSGAVFTKKDGGKIYLIFGMHQNTKDQAGTASISEVISASAGSRVKVETFIDSRIQMPNLRDLRSQGQTMRNLKESGKISWTALGMLPGFSDSELKEWRMDTDEIRQELKKLDIPDQKVNQALEYAWGGVVNAAIQEDAWTKGLRLVAVDSDRTKKLQGGYGRLVNTLPYDEMVPQDQKRMSDFLDSKFNGGDMTRGELEQFVRMFRETDQDKARILALATLKFLELRKQRDREVASNLASIPGNGALNMGTSHGKGIKEQLVALCSGGQTAAAVGVESSR